MLKTNFMDIESIRHSLGHEVGVSSWFEITQARVSSFADATDDHQWIHVDVERAKKESPFGTTIAHGYFTLSLISKFFDECLSNTSNKMAINYGVNKVRFPSPVKVGSMIRAHFTLDEVEEIEGGVQIQWLVTVEVQDQEKPACVAHTLTRWYY